MFQAKAVTNVLSAWPCHCPSLGRSRVNRHIGCGPAKNQRKHTCQKLNTYGNSGTERQKNNLHENLHIFFVKKWFDVNGRKK